MKFSRFIRRLWLWVLYRLFLDQKTEEKYLIFYNQTFVTGDVKSLWLCFILKDVNTNRVEKKKKRILPQVFRNWDIPLLSSLLTPKPRRENTDGIRWVNTIDVQRTLVGTEIEKGTWDDIWTWRWQVWMGATSTSTNECRSLSPILVVRVTHGVEFVCT